MRNYLYIVSFLCCLQGLLFGQTSLGYNLNEGEIFIIEQEAEQQIIQSLEGTSHELTNRISGVLHFRVLKAEDTGYLLEFMFKDLDFQIESSLQGMLLDIHAAEPDPADTQSQVFNAMLNVPVEMKLGRHGKILEVIGGDSLVSTMVKQAGLADEFNKTLMRKSLEREFGSRALAQSYEQMTYFYPDSPLNVGDQWENGFEGRLTSSNTWRLDSLNLEKAVIRGKATIAMKTADSSSTMYLEGTQETMILADRPSGFLQEMHVQSKASGISTSAQTGDLEIPTTITSNVIYRLIEQKHVQ
jgi:hypothetical protein